MSTSDELHRLDPALLEAPPAPGSARYTQILEAAMSQTTAPQRTPAPAVPAPATPVRVAVVRRRRSRSAWAVGLLGSAAAAAAVVAAVSLSAPDAPTGHSGGRSATGALSAQRIVLTAADRTADATTLRASLQLTDHGRTVTATGDFNGSDAVIHDVDAKGAPDVITTIGTDVYETHDGSTSASTQSEDDTNAPFAESAASVITAAVTDGAATEVGTEQVRGTDAVHYRVLLTDASRSALSALGARQLAWFDLEEPDQVTGLDVWVADGLVRRILVVGSEGPQTSTTTEFYDFGAPITITPPPVG